MLVRTMFKSKIHRATVTGANVQYIGSITIDADLLRQATGRVWRAAPDAADGPAPPGEQQGQRAAHTARAGNRQRGARHLVELGCACGLHRLIQLISGT